MDNHLKSILHLIMFCLCITLTLSGCSISKENKNTNPNQELPFPTYSPEKQLEVREESEYPTTEEILNDSQKVSEAISDEFIPEDKYSFIKPEGITLEQRINSPKGYSRIPSSKVEITSFMREMTLKEDGSDVLLYNGDAKNDQKSHVAVFDLDIGDRDLQQCADSVIRVYAEYYWSLEKYDKIAFHLTNGFLMEYTKWRDGNRIIVSGNHVRWNKSKEYDASYQNFLRYLNMVFAYAGTLSLSAESKVINISDIRPGDMFLEGGSPGHCLLVVDIAENEEGDRCFLLAQGYMPAQEFHIIKNPKHLVDQWYYEADITFPFKTPSWTFNEGSIKRWSDFPLSASDSY